MSWTDPSPGTWGGYILFLLNTHQPYIRHPEIEHCLEEHWLDEAITESYIPLLDRLEAIARDGIRAPVTMSITPSLLCMLDDGLRRRRYVRYLEERLGFLEIEMHRLADRPDLLRVVSMHRRRIQRCRELFVNTWQGDISGVIRRLESWGSITLLGSAATHAYLPLWNLFPEIVELQIRAGLKWHEHCFGVRPMGFWLPECGYFPGLDAILARNGIRFFFVDAHGLLNGTPRPIAGSYAPVHTPAGVAALPRDIAAHRQVWLESEGYPGDPVYIDRMRDASFEFDWPDAAPIAAELHRYPCGIRYWSGRHSKWPYNSSAAYSRCVEHANDFISKCRVRAERVHSEIHREPLICALFDTELFGHWWYEGPIWLDQTLRRLASDDGHLRLTTPEDYLKTFPVNQVVQPTTSSWGYQGYSEVWLMGRNHWIYPPLFSALEWLRRLVTQEDCSVPWKRAVLNMYIRELLLAQSSDWAFLMHSEPQQWYAKTRVEAHLRNLHAIQEAIETNSGAINLLEERDNGTWLFGDLDLVAEYQSILHA